MASASEKIIYLRQLLAERFGRAPGFVQEPYSTGMPALDTIGIPRAVVTDIVSSGPGGVLLLYGLLHAATRRGERVVLIDGKDSFVPKGLPQPHLNRLLWTRCHEARQAIQATDLAIRDGNIPLVVLLLTLNPLSELRRIPATAWHRLQMLAEKSAVTVLVFSPQAQVGCARLRLSVGGAFPLAKLHFSRSELTPSLRVGMERRRMSQERR
jgi:hypothetical protein